MTTYKQVIIAQIGSTNPVDRIVPFEGLIWSKNFYLSQEDQDNSFWTTKFNASYEDVNTQDIDINTVTWSGQQLTSFDSLLELSYTYVQDAFYFDSEMQVLYIKNFYNYPPWQTTGMSVGIVAGYSSMADVGIDNRPINEAYFGQEHEPRLIASSVDDYQELEDWKQNQMVFKNATILLINSDGELDGLRAQVMNQRMDILLAYVPSDEFIEDIDFNVVTTGIISDVSFPDENTVSITASDRRKSWEDTIPAIVYEAGFGPLLPGAEPIDKNMQMVIGYCAKVPCVTLDEASGQYHAGYATTETPLQAISQVYTLENDTYTTVAYSYDLDTGIITLNIPGNADNGTVVADVDGIIAPSISGSTVSNSPLDIALFLINEFGGMPYVESLFDIETINSINSQRDTPAGYLIPIGGEVLRDVVEKCTFSINTVMYQKGSKITASVIEPSPFPVKTIYPDMLESMPGIAYDNADYMSRILTSYQKDHARDIYITTLEDTYEQDAVALYQFKVQYDFETILLDNVYAEIIGHERYYREWQILPELQVNFTSPIEFGFMDTVEFHYFMNGRDMLPNAIYRVTGLSKIKRTAKLEYIEEVTA